MNKLAIGIVAFALLAATNGAAMADDGGQVWVAWYFGLQVLDSPSAMNETQVQLPANQFYRPVIAIHNDGPSAIENVTLAVDYRGPISSDVANGGNQSNSPLFAVASIPANDHRGLTLNVTTLQEGAWSLSFVVHYEREGVAYSTLTELQGFNEGQEASCPANSIFTCMGVAGIIGAVGGYAVCLWRARDKGRDQA